MFVFPPSNLSGFWDASEFSLFQYSRSQFYEHTNELVTLRAIEIYIGIRPVPPNE